jgi:hypothetical protein
MDSLLDLFLFISRDIQADYTQKRNRYRLSSGTLTVQLDVTIDKADIREDLEIEKKWEPTVRERILYSMYYVEPHIYEAHERERMKAAPDGDWCYKAHLKTENRDRYLSNEMFIDNMHMLNSPQCRFVYETSRLDRGLQSLANLEIRFQNKELEDTMEVYPALYAEMLKKSEWLLAGQLGEDRARWRGALRRGKADIALPFELKLKDVCPVWIVGRGLVTLCRLYGRPAIH